MTPKWRLARDLRTTLLITPSVAIGLSSAQQERSQRDINPVNELRGNHLAKQDQYPISNLDWYKNLIKSENTIKPSISLSNDELHETINENKTNGKIEVSTVDTCNTKQDNATLPTLNTQNCKNMIIEQNNDVFNWEQYLALNDDIYNYGVKTKSIAENHWKNYGYKEKRKTCIPSFDWEFYLYYNCIITVPIVCETNNTSYDFNPVKIINSIDTEYTAALHWLRYGKPQNLLMSTNSFKLKYRHIVQQLIQNNSIINYRNHIQRCKIQYNKQMSIYNLNEQQCYKTTCFSSPHFKTFEKINDLSDYDKFILYKYYINI